MVGNTTPNSSGVGISDESQMTNNIVQKTGFTDLIWSSAKEKNTQ